MRLHREDLLSKEVDRVMEMLFGKGDELGVPIVASPVFIPEEDGAVVERMPKFDQWGVLRGERTPLAEACSAVIPVGDGAPGLLAQASLVTGEEQGVSREAL